MKTCLLILCLFGAGCASTTVYRNGQPILKTQANAKSLVFRQGDTYLRIDGLDHAGPTRAGGSVAGTIGTSIVSGITAAAAL